jgi:hypothetical protein
VSDIKSEKAMVETLRRTAEKLYKFSTKEQFSTEKGGAANFRFATAPFFTFSLAV